MLGILRHGTVQVFSNQYIETEFLFYLIPLNSYFIRRREKEEAIQMSIPLNGISLRSYYIPLSLMFGPVILFFLVPSFYSLSFAIKASAVVWYIPFIVILCSVLYGVYLLVTYGKPKSHEKKRRAVLELAMGINALPEWLSQDQQKEFFEQLKSSLPVNWKQLIMTKMFDSNLYYKLFAAIYYENVIEPSAETHALFLLLDRRINKELYA